MANEVMVVEKTETEELKQLPNPQDQPLQKGESIISRLERLGFKGVVAKADRMLRMREAYQKYTFVTPQQINEFNKKLKKETLIEDSRSWQFKTLVFVKVEDYPHIPSEQALDALEKAQRSGLFDEFVIAKIDWKVEIKDPIIFGRIEKCEDYFFISQWDNDVRVEEIILGK